MSKFRPAEDAHPFQIVGCINVFSPFHSTEEDEEAPVRGDVRAVWTDAQELLNEVLNAREYVQCLQDHSDGTEPIHGGPLRIIRALHLLLDRVDRMLCVDSVRLLEEEIQKHCCQDEQCCLRIKAASPEAITKRGQNELGHEDMD